MALGVFDAAGVMRLRLQREADESSFSGLLVDSFDELEAVAERKGGTRRPLDEKWTPAHKASRPPGLFSHPEMRAG